MRQELWKRAVGILTACLMIFTAVPVTALADGEAAGALENIAANCEITVPSEQNGKPASNMVDGSTDTMWINDGAKWPCTIEFALPAANTKCVKKVVLKFESHSNRSMDVKMKYALNGVVSDLADVPGSEKTATLSEGYEFVFDVPQAMSHLYVTLDRPLTDGAAGQFWPAVTEAGIYIDQDAEEVVELENIAVSRGEVSLEASVNASAEKKNAADGKFDTYAALHTKNFSVIETENGTLPFVEVKLDVDQKIRQFVLAMKEDTSGAVYGYTILGKKRQSSEYAQIASGTIGTQAGSSRKEITVSELEGINAKEVEYHMLKAVFTAENAAAKNSIPQLAEFQLLANKAALAEGDIENIAWGSEDLHANYDQDTVGRIVDGNTENTWSAKQYPAYVDIGLGGEYSLSEIEIYMPSNGYSQYSLYYSNDGQNYSKLAEKTSKEPCPEEGEIYQADGVKASSVRVLLEYNSVGAKAVLNEVRIKGEKAGEAHAAEFTPPESWEESAYNQPITVQDTIDEVRGIIRRNIGEAYVDWFTFEVGEPGAYDYYDIEDAGDGKVKITGNDGVSLASGLNHYLKYYCNVMISQVGNQVKMPEAVVPVGEKVHKECKVPARYAYNYCTMSYSMPFWGENEWRKELDWLALNGVNLVLDVTAQEEVWRQFLGRLGYTHQEAKDYIAGPAYYAWAYMANLTGFGGPVHDSWFGERTELARKNHLIMRKLGMQPVLQGYSGMVPVDIKNVASGEYALGDNDVITQGGWCSFQRPYMLRTTNDAYDKYAALFYECQKNVFGDISDYYATDPFHEGGNTGYMDVSAMSRKVLASMMEYNPDAVWVIQSWQGNPTNGLLNGLEGNREHALVLDLYAEKTPHWNETNPGSYGGGNFGGTPFVYCMLNNFGGRMGLHGHMDNIVKGVADAMNNSGYMEGLGIAPEGSQNNPVLYDLLFETVWCNDASQPLEKINTADWLKKYVRRRYGAESENAYQAMLILENTVYKASLNNLGQGAPESYINARPATGINAASTWGNAVISYDMAELERAARLLLEDYDTLKDSDGYRYDLADILKQVLSNKSQGIHRQMVNALEARNLEQFTEKSNEFLALIDKVDKVLSSRKEFLLGTWVESAKALAENADDFTEDLYEFNAKALITTWGGYPQAESGGLKDYSNRQWAGLTRDFYKQRWSMWIEKQKAELAGNSAANINWFEFEWAWARANTIYRTEASGADLWALGMDVLREPVTNPPVGVEAAREELLDILSTEGSKGENAYSAESWAPYAEAIQEVRAALKKDGVTAEELQAAKNKLTQASAGLVSVVAASKTELTNYTETLKEKEEEIYTPESWKAYQTALAKVEEVLANPDADRDMVFAAKARLERAVQNLALAPLFSEKAGLESYIDTLAGKAEKDYTPESWKVYAAALEEAKRVLADEGADLETVIEARRKLEEAAGGLRKPEVKPDPAPGPNPEPNPGPSPSPGDPKPNPGPSPSPGDPKPPVGDTLPKAGTIYKTKTLEYKVTASSDKVKTVSVQNLKNSKAKAITVPATIKIGKYTYKVTEIAPKAFRKKVKLASVTIGTNVRKIGKNAFEGCKKLKKVTIKSKVLKSVGKQALKGIYKKAKVSVPKKQYKAYVKLFKKAKTAKSVKIVKK